MNLLKVTGGAVAAVNKPILCTLKLSTGYTQATDFSQVPTYKQIFKVSCQIQSMTGQDLRQVSGLNLQGTMRAIYVCGNIEAVDRAAIKGGDLFLVPPLPTFPMPTTWLVAQVLEHWDGRTGWTKAAVVLQAGC